MTKKILIFGTNGMLGRYIVQVMSNKNYDIICSSREVFDISNVNEINLINYLDSLSIGSCDIIINAAGIIPQRGGDNYSTINSHFPKLLSTYCKIKSIQMIHISTNCVFSGKDGNYNEDSKCDAEDIYGISKYLGEPDDCCVIRTSIIGEELYNKKSLLEWCISQNNKSINGYTNSYWNGVTCLQLAEIIQDIIDNNKYWTGIQHIFSNDIITKYDLLKMISTIYNLNIDIRPINSYKYENKTLTTKYDRVFNIATLRDQIIKQKHFLENRNIDNSLCFIICSKVYKSHVTFLTETVKNINKLYPSSKIIIVDNNSDNANDFYSQFSENKSVTIIENTSDCKFELGAYKFATQFVIDNNLYFDYYICLQDSFYPVNKYDFNKLIQFSVKACPITYVPKGYLRGDAALKLLNLYQKENYIGCWCSSWVCNQESLIKILDMTKNFVITRKNYSYDDDSIRTSEEIECYMGLVLKFLNNNIEFSIEGSSDDNSYDCRNILDPYSDDIKNRGHYFVKKIFSRI